MRRADQSMFGHDAKQQIWIMLNSEAAHTGNLNFRTDDVACFTAT